jgi:molecular chaperone GrpE
MAETENMKNEQPGTEAEETVTGAAEEEMPGTEEQTEGAGTQEDGAQEDADQAAAEETAEEPEAEAEEPAAETEEPAAEAEEPAADAISSVKEKALRDKITALEDKVKRQMAEFDNFRKRTSKEKEQMFSMGERSVIEKMLPVVDNFERGLAAVPEAEKGSAIASGMEMIYKQMMKQLEDLGVKPIEAVGKEFDPNFHNAVMQVESDELESGVVAQEFQKGYTYHDTVIRHSMVGVVS